MRCNLYGNRVGRDILQGFLEEHRAHEVVDVVFGRAEGGDFFDPVVFRYGAAYPTGGASTLLFDDLWEWIYVIVILMLYVL